MCGRFALDVDVSKIKDEFPWIELPEEISSSYNIAPTQDVPVVTNTGKPKLELFYWGLVPFWADEKSIGNRMINARAETLGDKPSFKHAYKRRRCIILSSGYFEWMKDDSGQKQPVYITLNDHSYFAFAGLWEKWKDKEKDDPETLHSCTIITCEAASQIRKFHHRMPVILPFDSIDRWLDEGERKPEELQDLLKPYDEGTFTVHEVTKAVNSPQNNRPELLDSQQKLF